MTSPTSITTPSTPYDFTQLAGYLGGAVVTPADAGWNEARAAWNLSFDQRPEAVVFVETAADVANVIDFARSRALRVVAQGTGHLAGPLGDLAGAILVRTSRMRAIAVDAATAIVRAEPGVTWGEVSAQLAPLGLAALAGSSHDVGVVGYTLGGGYSWLARKYGLASSSVTAIELVTGNGETVRVDPQNDAELFWALRGGGGNFGVVTAMEFRAYPLETVYAGMLLFPLERAGDVLRAYEAWTRDLSEDATTCVRILRLPPVPELPDFLRGKSFAAVDGAIVASDAEAVELLAPLRALGPVVDTFTRIPASRLSEIHMDPPGPSAARGDGVVLDGLPSQAIEVILDAVGPGTQTALLAVDIRHLGGALARRASGAGAVDSLPGRFALFAVGMTPEPQLIGPVEAGASALLGELKPWAAAWDYGNFREVATPAERVYPAEAIARLRAVKERVDPTNLIRSAHPLN